MKQLIASIVLLFALAGCSSFTAPAPYKLANASRLKAVEPWLNDYAKGKPAPTTQGVSDVLRSWHVEVDAQQRNP